MKKILILVFTAFIVSCSAKLYTPTQSDADRGAAKYPGLSLADLNEGKATYEQKCQTCHGLKSPSSKDEAGWNKIVPPMVAKVNKKAGREEINEARKDQLLRYLVTMSNAAKR